MWKTTVVIAAVSAFVLMASAPAFAEGQCSGMYKSVTAPSDQVEVVVKTPVPEPKSGG